MMCKTLITFTLGCLVATAGCTTAPPALDRGITHFREGNYLFAADEFSEAIRREPRSVDAYVNRGVTRVRLGELRRAIEDYDRALQLDSRDPEIYFNRGTALVAAGQYDLAVQDFTRATDLAPAFARAWFNRGSALALAGQTEAARRDWLHAIGIEADPWTRTAMRRSAGLESGRTVAGVPTTESTVAPPPVPGTADGAVPLRPSLPPAAMPAASPQSIDARTLATRALSREVDGDHAGALQDLNAAIAVETDPARRAALENLLRRLEAR
jgi:tetratricopeptide (TPR) repeat protein